MSLFAARGRIYKSDSPLTAAGRRVHVPLIRALPSRHTHTSEEETCGLVIQPDLGVCALGIFICNPVDPLILRDKKNDPMHCIGSFYMYNQGINIPSTSKPRRKASGRSPDEVPALRR